MAHILVVDDDPGMRQLATDILRLNGHTTEVAENGEEGLTKARAHKPNLIITDVTMPKVDGIALLKLLRQDPETSNIPVIAMTGNINDSNIFAGTQPVFNGCLLKPFSPQDLIELINASLRKK